MMKAASVHSTVCMSPAATNTWTTARVSTTPNRTATATSCTRAFWTIVPRVSFNGKIYVHPDAQKTDAKQSNRVLLLSDDAVIDTKPQLEIYADDVKCTHGATVGQIDETAMYYLRSRGISEDLARSLLVYAFANEIASALPLEAVREHVERFLLAGQSLSEL